MISSVCRLSGWGARLSFEVVVTRFAQQSRESPAALLERLLGLEPEQARQLSARTPAVVVSRTTREHASLLADQLRSAGAQVQVIQAARRPPSAATTSPSEARRPAIREVYAARADERELSSRALPSEPRANLPAATRPLERAAELRAEAQPAAAPARVERATAPLPEPTPVAPGSRSQSEPQAPAAATAEARTPEPLAPSVAASTHETPFMAKGASAELHALAARGLGDVNLSRFTMSDQPGSAPAATAAAGQASASGFGSDPLFPAEVVEREKTNALLDDFDDVINRPLDFGAATPKAKAASAVDSEIEGLFSAPVRGAARPKNEPRAAAAPARGREAEAPRHSSSTTAQTPTQEIVIYDAPEAPKSRKLMKGALTLLLLCLLGVVGAALGDSGGGESPRADNHVVAGAALAEGDTEQNKMHVLVRMAPKGIDRSMALVLRELVTGTHKVQMDIEGFPEDAQCLLVRAEDGMATKRIRKLLRTGMRVPLNEGAKAAFVEHEASLRLALGDKVMFKPLCLSVDLYKESLKSQQHAP
jgi:hypothetical protein